MAKVENAFYQKDWIDVKAEPNPKEGTYEECKNVFSYFINLHSRRV